MIEKKLSLQDLHQELNVVLESAKKEMKPQLFSKFKPAYENAIETLDKFLSESKLFKIKRF